VVRAVVACLLLIGCGRFGFGDDATEPDAEVDAFVPLTPLQLIVPAPFSTTSTVFVDVSNASLTLPPSTGTAWVVMIAATMESPTLSSVTVEARYIVDGVERGMGGTQTSTPGHPGPWQSFAVVTGTSTPQQIQIQLRDASGAGGTLSTLTLVAIPLPPASLVYATNDPPHDITWLTRSLDTTLSLGALTGDHVFMVLVDVTDLPGLSDCYVEWRGPADELWLVEAHQPRESWQSFMAVHRASVDTANAQVTLYTHGGGGGGGCQVRDVRAIAISVDAFASVDHARDDDFQGTAAATATTKATLTSTSAAANHYVFYGAALLDEDCNTVADAERTATFTRDSSTTTISHATDNCSYAATYATVALLASAPQMMSVGFSSGVAGGVVEHKASELLLLGLR
jgi:hypothetical protein